MISLNFTLFIQIVVFLTFLWILNRFLFQPVLDLLDERRDKTEGLRSRAEEMEKEAKTRVLEYEGMLREARAKAIQLKNTIKKEGLAEEKEILGVVIKETKDVIEREKMGIYKEVERVKQEVEMEAKEISRSIVEKVLGRRVK